MDLLVTIIIFELFLFLEDEANFLSDSQPRNTNEFPFLHSSAQKGIAKISM